MNLWGSLGLVGTNNNLCYIRQNKLILMAIKVTKPTVVTDRYAVFLDLMDALYSLKLADMEKKIICAFFWTSNGVINTISRKSLVEKLGITSFNLNNQIGKLRKKNLILAGNEVESIIPALIPDIEADKTSLVVQFELSKA